MINSIKMSAISSETIHSGHFMASNVHELKFEDDEEIDVVSESGMEPPDPEVTPDTKDDKPVTFYKFGPITTRSIAIDVSLSKLNKCIQIAYEKGKLTTPKWKNFKGLKLDWKDRIRLNNVIWRAWHMQFVLNNRPKFCFFSIPDEDYWHTRSEASVLEGMYWKRRLETVCAQYTRWRHFYFKHGKRRRSITKTSNPSGESGLRKNSFFDDELLFSSGGNLTPPLNFENDDDFTSWFTDTLFSSLNQPYMFPNPKQFAQSGNADLVQPGLIQLQPSLEEIMASLESNNSSYLMDEMDNDVVLNDPTEGTSAMDLIPGPSARSSSSIGSHYTRKDYDDASLLVNYTRQAYSGPLENSSTLTASSGNNYQSSRGTTAMLDGGASGRFLVSCGETRFPLPRNAYSERTICSYPTCGVYLPCSMNSETGPRSSGYENVSFCAEHWPGKRQDCFSASVRTRSIVGPVSETLAPKMHPSSFPDDRPSVVQGPQNRKAKNAPLTAELLSSAPRKAIPKSNSRKQPVSLTRKTSRKKSAQPTFNCCTDNDFPAIMQPPSNSFGPTEVPLKPANISFSGLVPDTRQQQPPKSRRSSLKKQYRSVSAVEPSQISAYDGIRRTSDLLCTTTITSTSTTTPPNHFRDFPSKIYQETNSLCAQNSADRQQSAPKVYAKTASSVCAPVSALLASPRTSIASSILRPIPLNLSRQNDQQSAFSSLSPSGSTFSLNLSAHPSPMPQCSPLSSGSGSTGGDFYRPVAPGLTAGNGLSPPNSFVQSPPTSGVAAYLPGSSSAAQNTSVLILPPFNGMQFPFSLAVPYAGTSPFCASTPKEEPAEKNLSKPPDNAAVSTAAAAAAPSTCDGQSSAETGSSDPKSEPNQSQAIQSDLKISKIKSTKRAADSTIDPSERKRMQHLHAEQTRRSALKNGFELLEELLPDFHLTNSKSTNASVLIRAGERIRYLKENTVDSTNTISSLKSQIQELKEKIGNYQSSLPIRASPAKCEVLKQRHAAYVKDRCEVDQKFWLLHKVTESLFETFKSDVKGANIIELLASANEWASVHCNHAELRPVVSQLLVSLATDSPMLVNPAAFHDFVINQTKKL